MSCENAINGDLDKHVRLLSAALFVFLPQQKTFMADPAIRSDRPTVIIKKSGRPEACIRGDCDIGPLGLEYGDWAAGGIGMGLRPGFPVVQVYSKCDSVPCRSSCRMGHGNTVGRACLWDLDVS